MSVYSLFSDPHLFTNRAAHTTRDSARLLQAKLFDQALLASEPHGSLCLGDLFDKASNPEAALVQGYEVARRCQMVMSGNHDLTNREGSVTTLDALHSVLDDRIVIAPDISTPYFETWNQFWIVPHHASQALFEEALRLAAEDSGPIDNPNRGHRYLLLHCNYDVPFDTEDSTLNLSPELAEELLQSFSRIFIGHEHNPKTFWDDRVVLVGNTHPTSFSDISDKYIWRLDTRSDYLTRTCIWLEERHYLEIEYGSPLPDLTGVQFVDVVGAQPVENGVEVADYVRSIWNAGDDLLAVRNNVEILDHLADADVDTSKPALVDLKTRIFEDLNDSDLQPLYRRLLITAEEE